MLVQSLWRALGAAVFRILVFSLTEVVRGLSDENPHPAMVVSRSGINRRLSLSRGHAPNQTLPMRALISLRVSNPQEVSQMLIPNLNGSAERFCTSGGRAAGVRLIEVLKIALNDAAERRDVYSDAISSRMNQPRAKCLASRSTLKEEKKFVRFYKHCVPTACRSSSTARYPADFRRRDVSP